MTSPEKPPDHHEGGKPLAATLVAVGIMSYLARRFGVELSDVTMAVQALVTLELVRR